VTFKPRGVRIRKLFDMADSPYSTSRQSPGLCDTSQKGNYSIWSELTIRPDSIITLLHYYIIILLYILYIIIIIIIIYYLFIVYCLLFVLVCFSNSPLFDFFSCFFLFFLGAQSAERRAQSADVFVFLGFGFFQEGRVFDQLKNSVRKTVNKSPSKVRYKNEYEYSKYVILYNRLSTTDVKGPSGSL
jgi:hypothetical protein